MIDAIQLISMRKAKAYLDKKERQKEVGKNRITKLIFLAASVLLDKLFFIEGGTCKMIPKHTLGGIKRYVENRIPPGGFLTAVLENNLRKSFGQADKENREALFEIVCHCYKELPYNCWGSPEKVKNWLLGKNRDEEV